MFFVPTESGYLLRIRLMPNSSANKVLGLMEGVDGVYLKIGVTVVPEKGKANKVLIEFLAKALGLPKSAFEIVSGATDRFKKISLRTSENIDDKLNCLGECHR